MSQIADCIVCGIRFYRAKYKRTVTCSETCRRKSITRSKAAGPDRPRDIVGVVCVMDCGRRIVGDRLKGLCRECEDEFTAMAAAS